MATPLRVLIVEDSEDDALLLVRELVRGSFDPEYSRVETAEAMREALSRQQWDIVISDYSMPDFSGPAALDVVLESGLDLPFILMSGHVGEETGVNVMTAGAHDFIQKGQPARLLPAIERELKEARERAATRDAIERYVSPKLYSMIRDRTLRMGGDLQEITIIKTDLRNFTTLAESMEPQQLITFLNRYFARMVSVVHRYEGEIDKFMGDAVLAKFGTTKPLATHAEQAVFAMLDMIDECVAFNAEITAEGLAPVHMGIGCNTGLAVVGNVGSPERMEYTVISDTVNTAQRIEELCKEFHWDLLISESTYDLVRHVVEAGDAWSVQLRGQGRQTRIYPVLGRRGTVPTARRLAYQELHRPATGCFSAS